GVVLHEHAVVEDRDVAGYRLFPVRETRAGEDDVVCLPSAWRSRGVLQRRRGSAEFDMQLAVAKLMLGENVATTTDDFRVAVLNFPSGKATLLRTPRIEILAVEQDDRV